MFPIYSLGPIYVALFYSTRTYKKERKTFGTCGLKQALYIMWILNHLIKYKMRILKDDLFLNIEMGILWEVWYINWEEGLRNEFCYVLKYNCYVIDCIIFYLLFMFATLCIQVSYLLSTAEFHEFSI